MSFFVLSSEIQSHPNLILTKKGVEGIRSLKGTIPFLDKTISNFKKDVDAEIKTGVHVPIPKDMAGGYTHERHKKNFLILQKAGVLFQILEDNTYAEYIKSVFMEYAEIYPTLPIHPQPRSYARGKIFWQCLNDANWLVYMSQAYDCIYEYLSKKERDYLEKNLFRPFADYLSIENPQFFNRIHNHSTWGNAAVGMIGLVMNDEEIVNRALYGLKQDNIDPNAKDNDGGFIKTEGQEAGFFANLENPFSPDGYYTEGPYYQRYAMYPFMLFATGLENVQPERKIFEYKGGVLIKAVYALLNLTDSNGEFYPLNDAQKGMSYYSRELISAVDIAYHFGGKDPKLLSIAKKQGQVILDDAGLSVAIGIRDKKEQPFVKESLELHDGNTGKEGGVGILRYGNDENEISLVMKYTKQGLSHGHYDKLSFSFYDNGKEVFQDYGLARFVNIDQKNGGGYLKENTTWAKQTIAHNTIVQNKTSHFNGNFATGNKHHSEKYIFDASNKNVQVVSATETNAYERTKLHRTLALIKDEAFESPFVLDIFKISSETENMYHLPYYYLGQIMTVNFPYETPKNLEPMGTKNGYQHLWKEGTSTSLNENSQVSWMSHGRFYTLTTVTSPKDTLFFARTGANDPEFNLRRDPSIIIQKKNSKETYFVSIIESHGHYDPVSEIATNSYSILSKIEILYSDENYVAVSIKDNNGEERVFVVSHNDTEEKKKHSLTINKNVYEWSGKYYFKPLNK